MKHSSFDLTDFLSVKLFNNPTEWSPETRGPDSSESPLQSRFFIYGANLKVDAIHRIPA